MKIHRLFEFRLRLRSAALSWLLIAGLMGCEPATVPDAATMKSSTGTPITVFKSPTCGCCKHWVTHLEANGFAVTSEDRNDMEAIKASYGVPEEMHSCHTAVIGDYIIEGHVPATDIRKLLQERPAVAGLSAPGMPQKSPGMQAPGLPPKDYDVISFTSEGTTRVYTSYQ